MVYLWGGWSHLGACGMLVPQPWIEPTPPALEAWSLNHCTAREVPTLNIITSFTNL